MRNLKLAIGMLAVATFALAQNAGKNTAGPTANDYRLQVIQPTEGATVTGPSVQVIVDLNAKQQLASQEKRDSDSMPQARVTVFLDDQTKGTLHDEHNVLNIENVAPGPHKLVLEARNLSGEIIDHKEVNFVSVEAESTNRGSTANRPSSANAANPPAEASSSSSSSSYSASATTAPETSSASSAETESSTRPEMSESSSGSMGAMSSSSAQQDLPQTGSSAPLLAVAGLGLLGLGLAIRSGS